MFKNYIFLMLLCLFQLQAEAKSDTLFVQADFERIEKALDEESFRPAYAHLLDVNISLSELLSLEGDGASKGFKLYLESKKALGLALHFSSFKLPKSGVMLIEDWQGQLLAGPYTAAHNTDGGSYALPLLGSSRLVIRYTQSHLEAHPEIDLRSVAHAFRDVPFSSESPARDFGNSESCQVNVNCSEGSNWGSQSRAVTRISVKVGQDLFWCTGTLMNNTNQDCKPYVLTADHCGEGANAADLDEWIFYFQYESASCNSPSSEGSLANKSITGCTLIANSGGAGDTDSDFYLLELSQEVPSFFNPFFAGWDRSGNTSSNGVGIHHPAGDLKKISTYTSAAVTDSWGGTVSGTHWRVRWVATSNGHGVTEAGSSGSALFNNQGRVIGMLTGGSSACTSSPGSGPNASDYYGKLSYAWESEGTANSKRLKPWLDPMNSGLDKIGGIAWPCLEEPLTGMDENASEKFTVFPIPVESDVFWNLPNIVVAKLYDLGGRRVLMQENSEYLRLDGLQEGMYLLELQDIQGGQFQTKILVK